MKDCKLFTIWSLKFYKIILKTNIYLGTQTILCVWIGFSWECSYSNGYNQIFERCQRTQGKNVYRTGRRADRLNYINRSLRSNFIMTCLQQNSVGNLSCTQYVLLHEVMGTHLYDTHIPHVNLHECGCA